MHRTTVGQSAKCGGALHQPPTGEPQVSQVGRTLPHQTWESDERVFVKILEVVGSSAGAKVSLMMTSRYLIRIDHHVWLALKSSSQSVHPRLSSSLLLLRPWFSTAAILIDPLTTSSQFQPISLVPDLFFDFLYGTLVY